MRTPWLTRRPVLVLALLVSSTLAGAQTDAAGEPLFRTTGVPAGFEQLVEPQLTAVDVFYGGRLLLTTIAEYTPTSVRFLKPEQVVGAISNVSDPASLTAHLATTLDSNSDKLCKYEGQPLCGKLMPDIAGVIFDVQRFRVSLFVNPSLLSAAQRDDPRYLTPPDNDQVTLVQNFSALATGNDQGSDQFTLFGITRAGRMGHYAFADWVSTDQQGLSFDQIGYRHGLVDHEITAGLFEPTTDALRGLRRDLLLGGSVMTSIKRRQDLASIIASPIDLFLALPARVDIFRDGRLVASRFYDAGNQLIDTSTLPTGAYPITLVITDETGISETRQEFFIKSTLLPPPGSPQWFVEAGEVRVRSIEETLAESVNNTMLRSGYRWRQYDWLGLGVAAAASEDEFVGEVSGNYFVSAVELGSELFASSQGSWGWGLRGSSRIEKATLSASAQRNRVHDRADYATYDYALISPDRWLYSVQASRPVHDNGLLLASYSRIGSEAVGSSRSATLRYIHNLPLPRGQGLTISAEIANIDDDKRIGLAVQWRALSTHWTHTAGVDWVNSDLPENEGFTARAGTRWRDQDRFVDDLELGASARINDDDRNLNLDGTHASQFGRARAQVAMNDNDVGTSRQYLAGFDTSLVMDNQRKVSIGGLPPGEAAAVIDLSDAEDTLVDIHVDGQRKQSVRGGYRVPVVLPAYDQYRLSLRDRGITLLSLDNTPRSITLYPGEAEALNYTLERINIIVSRLYYMREVCSDVTNECYQIPQVLAGARISGLKGLAFSDEEGYFQGEIPADATTLEANIDGQPCRVDVSAIDVKNGVMRASRLYCVPLADAGTDAEVDATQ